MKDGRALKHKTLEEMRLQAVSARKAGMSVSGIAKSLGMHRGSVSRWFTKLNRSGRRSLKSVKAPGPTRKLDCKLHGRKIVQIIKTEATKYKFENPLWNCSRVRKVLRTELKVNVSTTTVWRGLRKLNLSVQKPERCAVQRDPKKRRKWLEKTWPQIKRLAKREHAIIFFQDEAAIRLTPTLGTTWGIVGVRPKVTLTGKRATVCVMSAVSPSGRLFFSIPDQMVNADVFIGFLKDLLKEYPKRKIFVIADQASAHKSLDTLSFVFNCKRLRLFLLPPYSPDFNPDEKAWDHLKNHELKAHQAFCKASLKALTTKKLNKMSKDEALIRSFFKRMNVT